MSEIGSEFWDVPVCRDKKWIFPESVQWYLSGRSALKAIIEELKGARSVSLPSWCCDSIVKPFIDAQIEVHFYPVYFQNVLVQERNMDCDVLFLMDYFGYSVPSAELTGYKGTVIRDVTHSIFSTSYTDADYYFGSLRKWCGVWSGGYAWTCDGHRLEEGSQAEESYIELRRKAMNEKMEYINGNRSDKNYLTIFNEAEDLLEHVGISQAIKRDLDLIDKLDVMEIKEKRRTNAEVLRKAFPNWLIFSELGLSDAPMFVPVLIPYGKRDDLRSYLIKHEIYCPVHWPISNYHNVDERTGFIYQNELSLVCDQRYTEDDMCRIVGLIKAFMKEA